MMSIMTGDNRFEEAMQSVEGEPEGKEPKTMCEFLDRVEEKGKMEKAVETAMKLIARGKMTENEIAEDTGLTLAKVLELKNGVPA